MDGRIIDSLKNVDFWSHVNREIKSLWEFWKYLKICEEKIENCCTLSGNSVANHPKVDLNTDR